MCPGSIYIELIHIISGYICSCEELYNICQTLWDKLEKGNTECFYVYFTEDECKIDEDISDGIVYKVTGTWDEDTNRYWYEDMELVE